MRIVRIGQPQTLEKYESGIRSLVKYYVRKSKTKYTADDIIETFKQGLNRVDKLNGVVLDDNGKAIGFFVSRIDTTFFADIDPNEGQPVIFIEHMDCPNSYIEPVYRGLRDKLRDDLGAKSLFMFTHRNPEAWVKLGASYGEHFETYGYIVVDKIKEDT